MMQNPTIAEPVETTRSPIVAGTRAYLLAALCVGLAWLVRWALDPLWGNRLPYGSFFLAVVAVTQFTDVLPTVCAIIAGFLLGTWSFVGQRHSLVISDPLYQFNGFMYFVVCAFVVFFSLRMRRAVEREQASATALGELAREQKRLVQELQNALADVKTLTGLFPICSYCKKIRDDKGYWTKIEQYLHRHSGADFTHSICPDCAKSHYGEFSPSDPQRQ